MYGDARTPPVLPHKNRACSHTSIKLVPRGPLGYISRDRDSGDARAVALRLSAQGARAMQAGSVLDSRLVAAMLSHLSTAQRARAIEGLALLAQAALRMPKREVSE